MASLTLRDRDMHLLGEISRSDEFNVDAFSDLSDALMNMLTANLSLELSLFGVNSAHNGAIYYNYS